MKNHAAISCAAALLALATAPASAGSVTTLYSFTGGTDGTNPNSGLIAGPHGSLIGTASYGGTGTGYSGSGTVFQLSPPAKGQTAWSFTALYAFTAGADGARPWGLVADAAGAVYGVAQLGGTFNGSCTYGTATDYGCGVVFKLAPPRKGQTAGTFSTIYTFQGNKDGYDPLYGLAIDAAGALYGTTVLGGAADSTCTLNSGADDFGCGTVFKLTPPAQGQTAWTKSTLYSFKNASDGYAPTGPVLLNTNGNIYGNTSVGGNTTTPNCATGADNGCGAIFQLSPPPKGKTAWTKKTILAFKVSNGSLPVGGLTIDSSGNLFGGGQTSGTLADCPAASPSPGGCGVAFELSPPASGKTAWTGTTLYKFTNGADGGYPWDPPVAFGNTYYMTTSGDEVKDFGSIVELSPPAPGKTKWTETTGFTFTNDMNGSNPWSTLLPLGSTLYGTTAGFGQGPAPYGTVFGFTP